MDGTLGVKWATAACGAVDVEMGREAGDDR